MPFKKSISSFTTGASRHVNSSSLTSWRWRKQQLTGMTRCSCTRSSVRLRPRTTRKPVRIKSLEGAPLSSKDEHGEIMQYFGALFKNDSCQLEPLPDSSSPAGTHKSLVFSEEEMRGALKQNVIGKSVPHNHAPAGAWAACSGLLLGPLCTIANDCLSGSVSVP